MRNRPAPQDPEEEYERAACDRHVGDVEDTCAQESQPQDHEVDDVSVVEPIDQIPGSARENARERDPRGRAHVAAHGHTFLPLPGTPFRGAAPGRVDESVAARLSSLEGAGRLFGQWKAQVEVGRDLAKRRARTRVERAERGTTTRVRLIDESDVRTQSDSEP